MAAADPGASAVALVSTPATDGGILSLLMSAALPPVQVDVVVGHAPSKAVRSSGITSASNGRIGEESRLAIENSVKEQDNARSKVSREFTEYNADIERLRKEEIVTCDVPALGGHMPFLVLELPVQATVRRKGREGERRGERKRKEERKRE